MTHIDGTWRIEIATPMGTQRFTLVLHARDGVLTGTATNANGSVDITDGTVHGDAARMSVSLSAPIPLTLVFTLTATADSISGESRAGSFPPSPVTGVRE